MSEILHYSRGVMPAIGRNGLTKSLGIHVSIENDVISMNPYNTLGKPGKAGIPVPVEDVQELINILQNIKEEHGKLGN